MAPDGIVEIHIHRLGNLCCEIFDSTLIHLKSGPCQQGPNAAVEAEATATTATVKTDTATPGTRIRVDISSATHARVQQTQ